MSLDFKFRTFRFNIDLQSLLSKCGRLQKKIKRRQIKKKINKTGYYITMQTFLNDEKIC